MPRLRITTAFAALPFCSVAGRGIMRFIKQRPAQVAFTLSVMLSALAHSTLAQTTANPYVAGNLVVSGVDTSGTSASAGAITLYQYTTGGATVSSIVLPSTSGTGSNPLTISNNATSEGALTLSTGGDYLTIQGYDAAAGTTSIAGTASTMVQREVGTISTTGVVNTSTVLGTTAYSGNNIRSSVYDDAGLIDSSNKTAIYTAGVASSTANGYLRSTTLGNTTTAAAQAESTTSNTRVVNIFNNASSAPTLYYSTGSGTNGIYQLAGAPGSTTTASLIAASPNPYDFLFTNSSTLYVADSTNGLEKYTLSGSTFNLAYQTNSTGGANNISGLTGLTYNSSTGLFYGITPTSLISFKDTTTGFTQNTLVTAPTNTAFRGVDFAPTAMQPVPAPPSLVSMGIGLGMAGLGALVRRRRAVRTA